MVTTRTSKPEGRSAHYNWAALGRVPPQGLVNARVLAHYALQWPARAARANLKHVADDSHTSFDWDGALVRGLGGGARGRARAARRRAARRDARSLLAASFRHRDGREPRAQKRK